MESENVILALEKRQWIKLHVVSEIYTLTFAKLRSVTHDEEQLLLHWYSKLCPISNPSVSLFNNIECQKDHDFWRWHNFMIQK